MPTIPLNVILIWPGTNASIPAGWVRVTDLDGKFLKGALEGVEPNTTGGADTHTHTSPVHTHTMIYHAHSGRTYRSSGDFETHGGGHQWASRDSHYHDFTSDGLTSGNAASAITYLAGSSLPPYHEVIFIKPDGVATGLPDGAIALFPDGDIPTTWDVCDGNNSTPNLVGKYLRGAAAAGDAGATGGAIMHTHDVTHNHGSVGHAHTVSTSGFGGSSDGTRERTNTVDGAGTCADINHRHTMTMGTTSETPSTYTGTAGSAETDVQPLHKKLRAIQNNSGSFSKPRGIIAAWLGSLATIPQGWFICNGENGTPDMQGYHLKLTATEGEVGDTAGANTHSHAASNSHTHTAPGTHVHGGSTSSDIGTRWGTNADSDGCAKPHGHSNIENVTTATSSWNATTISADSSNNEPAYRTVVFIMFKYETFGGAAILGSALIN